MDIKQLFEKLRQMQAEADAGMDKYASNFDKKYNLEPGTTSNYLEGVAGASGGISNVGKSLVNKLAPSVTSKLMDLGVAIENKVANSGEMSKLRALMDNPVMNKLMAPAKAERNIRLAEKADIDKRIRAHKMANEEAEIIKSYPKDPSVQAMEDAQKLVDEKLKKKIKGEFDPEGTNPL